MDITIMTPQQMKIIDKYIKEEDFYKSNTGIVVKDLFSVLITYGMTSEIAMNNIEGIVRAMRNEYGE